MYICLKCTQFLKINAGNSLSDAICIEYNHHVPITVTCKIRSLVNNRQVFINYMLRADFSFHV